VDNVYEITVASVKRVIPKVKINSNTAIANFLMLGDCELVECCSAALIKKLPTIDCFITAEARGIPLAATLSSLLKIPRYVIARKTQKLYMESPMIESVFSITTPGEQFLYLDSNDIKFINNRRICIVDDVISTGETLACLEKLVQRAGGIIAAKAAVIVEGDATLRTDIIYLETLPIFNV